MKTLYQKLADYLEVDGWDHVQAFTDDLDGWADEIWELSSCWSPQGASAFIVLLVDPMWSGARDKGQGVWGVGFSSRRPADRAEAERNGTLRLRSSREEIEAFVEQIAEVCRASGAPDHIAAHEHSALHRLEILASKRCGCFFCIAQFAPSEIQDWIDAPPGATDASINDSGQTAICPKCGIDSVIGDASGYPIEERFLRTMHGHWFESREAAPK